MRVASQERPIGTLAPPAFFQLNQSWILIWFQNIYFGISNREYSGFVTNWSTKAYKAIISPLVTFSKQTLFKQQSYTKLGLESFSEKYGTGKLPCVLFSVVFLAVMASAMYLSACIIFRCSELKVFPLTPDKDQANRSTGINFLMLTFFLY